MERDRTPFEDSDPEASPGDVDDATYSRREALLAVRRYALVAGAASVVISAEDAAAQAAASGVCSKPNPPKKCFPSGATQIGTVSNN